MTADQQIGSVITVYIQRVTPFGLRVELNDGQSGVIREREISWSSRLSPEQLATQYHTGDALSALILGRTSDGHLELSLRLVQTDPWIGFPKRYKSGDVVKGVITGIQAYGVFVELEPGITGLLHASRLADWVTGHISDLFWPGDEVYVTIESIDNVHRRVDLAHSQAWAKRWLATESSTTRTAGQSVGSRRTAPAISIDRLPLGLWVSQARPRTVLVVDDYPAHLTALTTWLQRAGQRAIMANCAEEALELLPNEQPDLVLMDFGLPGMSGLDAVKQIRDRWPLIQCVIMTDWSRADEHMADLDRLRNNGVKLLIKPLLPEDLIDVLQPLDTTTQPNKPTGASITTMAVLTDQTLALSAQSNDELYKLLNRLRQSTGAIKVALFQLNPTQRHVSIAVECGNEKLRETAFVNLIHSPVRDAAEDEVTVRVEDVQFVEAYVRNLIPLLNFQACLGLPVPSRLPTKYAVFVFYAQAGEINSIHEFYTQATAVALGGLLEQREFDQHSIDLQRLALLGNLTRALVHEINHQLSPISFVIGDLEEQCGRLEQYAYGSVTELQADMHVSREGLRNLSGAVRNLIGTARMFHQMTIKSSEQIVKLDTAAGEVAQLLKDQADRNRVILEVDPIEQIMFTRTHATQVQQVLLNITLNAIQQIALIRPKLGGQVRIRFGQKTEGPVTVFQVYVEDDGPGIHRRLWERIFDLGFTTRQSEGSGLGLYISRSLIEAIGGRIFVAESAIMWGTTFVIELPLRL